MVSDCILYLSIFDIFENLTMTLDISFIIAPIAMCAKLHKSVLFKMSARELVLIVWMC